MKQLQLSRDLVCVLDDEDHAKHGGKRWSASTHRGRHVYAYRTEGGKRVYLHRLIAGAEQGMCVDHIDGDTLNNQRSNLRCVTNAQNSRNRHEAPRSATKRHWRALRPRAPQGIRCAHPVRRRWARLCRGVPDGWGSGRAP
ncbi:TPA: HNH endonuclease [Stenotrophomonas maltophilia]|nr:HNH endonuclease [Stenotrophomonas maltophilia]